MSDEAERRRAEAVARINAIDRDRLAQEPHRRAFFDTVYDTAEGDASGVPWADLAPKAQLVDWLAGRAGEGRRAIDIACGLGDNAEAIAAAGYATTAFDGSATAIDWARQRFPGSPVDYQVADLLAVPQAWHQAFDLVHECYTIQSVPPALHADFIRAIAGLVKPGGRLLVYTRLRPEDGPVDGPPWPLTMDEAGSFDRHGLTLVSEQHFEFRFPNRVSPHVFAEWVRNDGAAAA